MATRPEPSSVIIDTMQQVVLGRTGLEVSVMGLGGGGDSRLGMDLEQKFGERARVGVEGFDLGQVTDSGKLDQARAGDGGVCAFAELGVVAELAGDLGRRPGGAESGAIAQADE